MGNRRAPIVLAALALGGVTALGVWAYLGSVEDRAFQGARLAQVFTVKGDIKEGTPADRAIADGLIGPQRIPVTFRPQGAIDDLESIRGKVAATNLLTGQIVARQFFGAKTGTAFARQVPEGQVAISVRVDAQRGVANLVGPGDRVDILVVTPEGSKTLFQNVDVIAVGTATTSRSGDGTQEMPPTAAGGQDAGLVTFAVPLPAAQKIALAALTTPEGLYLALVAPENQPAPVSPLNAAGLFQGAVTPYA